MLNKYFKKDCKELIEDIRKSGIKVNCILTDPPYNISKKSGKLDTMKRNGFDFGDWDYNFNQTDWLDSIGDIMTKDASILIFNSWRNLGEIAKKLEDEGFEIKDLIRWIKPNPLPINTDRRYVSDYEFIIWAARGKWTFKNPYATRYLKPEIVCSTTPNSQRIHPTQKPVELIRELISVHTLEGDTVLDPFCGSKAIPNTCLKYRRNFIAGDINLDDYQKEHDERQSKLWLE